ncbi:DUF3313 domain-containing protein [Martelella sp. AMO21009]
MSTRYLALMIFTSALGGCASSPPHLYQGIASSAQMSVNSNDMPQNTPFAFTGDLRKLASHSSVVLEPIEIYRGPDNQFDNLSSSQIQELSAYAERAFSEALSKHGILAEHSSSTTLRLRIVLTGARLSVPVLGTVTKVTPVGFALNGVKAVAGKQGRFTGDVIYVVEFRDGTSGELLWAYISRQFPSAVDVGASIRPLDAAKAGIRQGADILAKDIAQRLSLAR